MKESTAFHHSVAENGKNSKLPSVLKTSKTQTSEVPKNLPVQCSSLPSSCSAESKQKNADHRMAASDKSNGEWTLVTSKSRSAAIYKPQEGDTRGARKSPESFPTQFKGVSKKPCKTKSKTNKQLNPASGYSGGNSTSELRRLQVNPLRNDVWKNEGQSSSVISLHTPTNYYNAEEPVNQSQMDTDAVHMVHASPFSSKVQSSKVKTTQQQNDLDQRRPTHQPTGCTDSIITNNEPFRMTAKAGSHSFGVLPNGVFLICEHFLHDKKKLAPKPCMSCAKQSRFVYGAWNNSKKEWQKMRPCPQLDLKVSFQKCWRFDNGKCQKNRCTFAHGEKELAFWTLQRQKGLYRLLFLYGAATQIVL